MPKLPRDAYDFYLGLGDARSYQAVADHFGVAKQTVTTRAVKEKWQERLDEVDRRARDEADRDFQRELAAGRQLQFKTCRAILAKGVEGLKSIPMTSAMDAVRAIDMAMRNERILLGEPTDRTAVSVEEILRKEIREWVVPAGQENDGWDEFEEAEANAE